ncbi:MAG: hypothetical protein HKM04_09180 [Legionellales bacterium]|nr:hypothetical protein [Legionellales bacterium]
MAVKTSTFSGWHLSGKDADAFLSKIQDKTPNPRAITTLQEGKKLLNEFDKTGAVILRPQKDKIRRGA